MVELVGEFVEGHVAGVGDVSCALCDGIPCEDDGAGAPGFAEAMDDLLGDDADLVLAFLDGAEGRWIEVDGAEFRVGIAIAMKDQHAGLGSDGEDHFLGEFEIIAGLEAGGGDETADPLVEPLFQILREARIQWDARDQDFRPMLLVLVVGRFRSC